MRNFVVLFAFLAFFTGSQADIGSVFDQIGSDITSVGGQVGDHVTSAVADGASVVSSVGSSLYSQASSAFESATSEAPSLASDVSSWGSSIQSDASTWLDSSDSTSTGTSASSVGVFSKASGGEKASGGKNLASAEKSAHPSDEGQSSLPIPSNTISSHPQGGSSNQSSTQRTTGASSGNGAIGSLVHYNSNDQLVEFLGLLLAGLAGAGAILL